MISYFKLLTVLLLFLGFGATACTHIRKTPTTACYKIKTSPGQAREIVVPLVDLEQQKLVFELSNRYALQFDVVLDPEAEMVFELEPIRLINNSLQCISPVVVCKYRF